MPKVTNVGPKYLANLPKKVIIKEEEPAVQAKPLEEEYLLNHRNTLRDRLRKLYNFYCVQGQSLGQGPTFDRIKDQGSAMSLGRFMQFCQSTRVFECKEITKDILMTEYKKQGCGKMEIDFDTFEKLLGSLDQKYLIAMRKPAKSKEEE